MDRKNETPAAVGAAGRGNDLSFGQRTTDTDNRCRPQLHRLRQKGLIGVIKVGGVSVGFIVIIAGRGWAAVEPAGILGLYDTALKAARAVAGGGRD